MGWSFSHDVADYVGAAYPLLAARPEEHTVALTNIDNVLAGRVAGESLFGWYVRAAGDVVTGAISMTPGFPLLISELPEGSEASLVDGLLARGSTPSAFFGEPAAVLRAGGCWASVTGGVLRERTHERLYRLAELHSPVVPGRARRAVPQDIELIAGWFEEFVAEAGIAVGGPPRSLASKRVEQRLAWLWQDESATTVAMALRSATAAGVARVGPVYTAVPHRRRGYGAAVTAACSSDALASGAEAVVLFTDLANPTSNAIYQQIGYRPISDRMICDVLS